MTIDQTALLKQKLLSLQNQYDLLWGYTNRDVQAKFLERLEEIKTEEATAPRAVLPDTEGLETWTYEGGWALMPNGSMLFGAAFIDKAVAEEREKAAPLVAKAAELVRLLDDAEVNHGGLWAGRTMRGRDELRQELSRWTK